MKKSVVLAAGVLAAACLAGITACGEEENELVLYTPTSEANLKILVPKFEEETGIHVEWVYGSSGDIKARILAEVGAPQGDVTWYNAGIIEQMAAENDAFETYVSKNDKLKPENLRNTGGHANIVNYTCPVLIWNKKMVNGTISGYADVLNHSEVKGLIAMGDSTGSSSAYDHLQNMLLAMGDQSKDVTARLSDAKGWEHVEGLYKMLDKKIIKSSSVSLTGVVKGEYAVGYSWDTKGYEAMEAKANGDAAYNDIEVCFMKEGVVASPSGVGIFKGAAHQKAAKKFVDWMCSKAGQQVLAKDIAGTNAVISGIEKAAWKQDINSLNIITVPNTFKADTQASVLEKLAPIHQKYTA